MKRILMLGGADIQVSAIKKAVELGHYVITCDYLPGNPGHKFSHEYCNVSTTDKPAVLKLAKSLNIDGIIAYASDPAALTAAYVAEQLNLPTNPFKAVEILSRKDLFRDFLKLHKFEYPDSASFSDYEESYNYFKASSKPLLIKPVDSSGSKGVVKLDHNTNFKQVFDEAIGFSRAGKIILEEFIEKEGYQIGGDGFLVNGELVFRCFGDIHFSTTNHLLPCSVSVPSLHSQTTLNKVHAEVQRLMSLMEMKFGGLNFDIFLTKDGRIMILEIGPRNGGNMIPELTEYCTGVDMKVYSIKAALGEDCSALKMTNEKKYFSHYVIHAYKSGIVKQVTKSDALKEHILYEHYNFKIGDKVEKFISSANRLGILLLKYDSVEQMKDIIYNMNKYLILQID